MSFKKKNEMKYHKPSDSSNQYQKDLSDQAFAL